MGVVERREARSERWRCVRVLACRLRCENACLGVVAQAMPVLRRGALPASSALRALASTRALYWRNLSWLFRSALHKPIVQRPSMHKSSASVVLSLLTKTHRRLYPNFSLHTARLQQPPVRIRAGNLCHA